MAAALFAALLATTIVQSGARGRPGMPNKEEKLRRAAEMGEIDNVRELVVEEKVNVDAVPMFGETALHWSSAGGHHPVVELLIDNGANVNYVANDGNTPLGKAAMAGHAAVVRSLCEAGANPNSQGGKKRWSPVHYAAVRSRLEALEIMLEFGADPSLKDSHGKTPLDLVAGRHNEVMVELKRLEPMLKLLGEVTAVLMQDDGAGTHNEREL